MSEKLKQDHYKVKAKDQEETSQYLQGRGAQFNTKNKFLKDEKIILTTWRELKQLRLKAGVK